MESLQDDEAEDEAAAAEAKKRAQEEKKIRNQLRAVAKAANLESPMEAPRENRPKRPLRNISTRSIESAPRDRPLPSFVQSRPSSAQQVILVCFIIHLIYFMDSALSCLQKTATFEVLHPSWEAKKKEKMKLSYTGIVSTGKKILFDD